jgi:hypothetical protein
LIRLVFCLALSIAGCGPPAPKCQAPFIGDPKLPPQAVMIWTDGVSHQYADVAANQPIPLEPPPQGGYVMYVGARILNMGACVEFKGILRDSISQNEVGMDSRTSTLHKHDDGWGWPDSSTNATVSNVNGCYDLTSKDVNGQPYSLEMTVTDKFDIARQVQLTQSIVPTCMLADPAVQADCICSCAANYYLGKCGMDAGGRD